MSKTLLVLGFLAVVVTACLINPYFAASAAGDGVTLLTRTFYPIADAYVVGGSSANYGGETGLLVSGGKQLSDIRRTFIYFDLSNIPPGSVIVKAYLKVYLGGTGWRSSGSIPAARMILCSRVAGSWGERSINWFNQPGSEAPTTYITVPWGTGAGSWLSFDVKSSLELFVAPTASGYKPNYGWVLKDAYENYAGTNIDSFFLMFYSKEFSLSSAYPSLDVSYYPPHLELVPSSSSVEAGGWVKMTVYRKTYTGGSITRGSLEVDLSSSSTSPNKRFSLSQGGSAITKLTIPDGSDHADFYYYDEKAGTWSIRVWTDDYMYSRGPGGIPLLHPVMNYGDDTEQLTVTPGPLHHFVFDTISSPKQVAVPFSITITAVDAYGNVRSDYTGTNTLSDTTGTISPSVTGAFVNGRWTGTVTIRSVGSGVKIQTSGAGFTGESNAFTVKAGPPAKLVIMPSSFTATTGVPYSYLNISLVDANNYPTTHTSDIVVVLSTTSPRGEFREVGTERRITSIVIPAGSTSVRVDYYDLQSGAQTLTASASGLTPCTATVTVIADTAPPTTTISLGSPSYTRDTASYVSPSTAFTLSASDDASGVKETRYRVDGGSWTTYTSAFNLSALPEGWHTLGYYSVDRVDNAESEKTLRVFLDKMPPVVVNASPTGSLVLGSASVRFSVKVEDAGSGVKEVRLSVDGASKGAMAGAGEYSATVDLSEGLHEWMIEVVDNVGNAGVWRGSFTLSVDREPPVIQGAWLASSPVFGEAITVTCEASDTGSGVKEVKLHYSTDGGAT